MSPSEAGEKGFRDRAINDGTLVDLLISASRVVPGWPADTKESGDFPRLTYFMVGDPIRRPGTATIRLQVDEWVWPDGTAGGRNRLLAIDAALVSVFDEAHWTYGGHRLYGLCLSGRDHPTGPGSALRRRRDIEIRVSPA